MYGGGAAGLSVEIIPSVTLSPKARNFVFVSVKARDTVTPNVHEAVRLRPSVAVQRTSVVPTGNVPPDGGVHSTESGDWPPVALGNVYDTAAPVVAVVFVVTGAGHVSAGGSVCGTTTTGGGGVGGGVGAVGVLLQAIASSSTSAKNVFLSERTASDYIGWCGPYCERVVRVSASSRSTVAVISSFALL